MVRIFAAAFLWLVLCLAAIVLVAAKDGLGGGSYRLGDTVQNTLQSIYTWYLVRASWSVVNIRLTY
jgi:hypothetical protein